MAERKPKANKATLCRNQTQPYSGTSNCSHTWAYATATRAEETATRAQETATQV